mgnify:CR=1 FL=1
MSKIGVAIISSGTGEDPQNLRRCLKSIAPYVEGIFVTLTGPRDQLQKTEDVCREFGAHISYHDPFWIVTTEAVVWLTDYLGYPPYMKVGDKLFLFDEARNFNFAQVPKEYEWIFWIDTDDVLVGGENLWKLKTIADQAKVELFFIKYVYRATLDNKGRVKDVLIEHLKERMVRNGMFKWVGPVHEALVELKPTLRTHVDDCHVLHMTDYEHIKKSIVRNFPLLELALYRSEGKDPRHIYFLAKAYLDLRNAENNEKAIPLIKAFLWGKYQSEWPEERAQAYEYLSDIYRQKGELNNAIKACMQALTEEPERNSIYLNIALAYLDKKEWDRALFWTHLANKLVDKKTTLSVNPRDMKVIKLSTIYTASLNKGKTYDAYDAASKLHETLPNDSSVKQAYDFIKQQKEQRDVATTISAFVDYLKSIGEEEKIISLLGNIPNIIKNDPLIGQIKREFLVQR